MRRAVLVAFAIGSMVAVTAGPAPAASKTKLDPNGTVRFAWTVNPTQLDPQRGSAELAELPTVLSLYDRLSRLLPTGKLAPMMAKSFDFSADGKTLTYKLRNDITFQDGSHFTANDVKATLDRARTGATVTTKTIYNMITSVDVVNDETVKITTNRPASDLPYTLAGSYGAIISAKAITGGVDLSKVPSGAGPYKLVEFRSGDRAIMERNTNYWDKANPPKLARLEVVGLVDDNARLNALKSGQIEAIQGKALQYPDFQNLGAGFKVFSMQTPASAALFMNTGIAPLDKLEVRQAINMAIDRKGIAEQLVFGQCTPSAQVIPLGTGHVKGLEPYPFNIAKAKALLTKAGFPNGFTLQTLVATGSQPQNLMFQAVQGSLAQIGINLVLNSKSTADLVTAWSAGSFPLALHAHAVTIPQQPGQMLQSNFLTSKYPVNGVLPAGFADAVNASFDATLSTAQQTATIEKAVKIATDNALEAPICAPVRMVGYKNTVTGINKMSYVSGGAFDPTVLGVLKSK